MLERGPDIERGRYVIEIMECNDCHTPNDTGDNSSALEENWLVLAKRMRQRSPMSWVKRPKAIEQDLRAIYRFVTYLGPKGIRVPAHLFAGLTPTTDYIDFPEPH